MESSLQKIIAAIVGVMILFIIPVYIAFEKADDVSYSLAIKLTQNFVDNVRSKGYISPEMYSDFVSGLYATNNTYDVNIEHVKKRYDPAIYIYDMDDNGERGDLLHVLDYDEYLEQYEAGEITIDVGVYNLTNSNIDVNEPSIRYDDGTEKGAVIKDKDGNELDPETLYKKKIDQYQSQDRIVIDQGQVYADIEKVTDFDKDIYIPSRISLFAGRIEVINKQGNEPDTLDYDTYVSKWAQSGTGYFDGPKYSSNNSIITYTPASMKINGTTTTKKQDEELYYKWINAYKSEKVSGDGRLVFEDGLIYADKSKLKELNRAFDAKLDTEATIEYNLGTIQVKNDKQQGGYTSLDYNTFIDLYNKQEEMVAYEGEIYTDENSDIENIRPGIWSNDKEYDELSEQEKQNAENLYKEKISEYLDNDAVIYDSGEIYYDASRPESKIDITDIPATIKITGNISVKNPSPYASNILDFSYAEKIRNLGEAEYITVDEGGTFSSNQITYTAGYVRDSKYSYYEIDYNAYDNILADKSTDTISVNRKITFDSKDDIWVNAVVVVTKTTKYKNGGSDDVQTITENIYTTIQEYIDINNSGKVNINGEEYDSNYAYSDDVIESVTINISVTPTYMTLQKEGMSTAKTIDVTDEIENTIQSYINNQNIVVDMGTVEYSKTDLSYELEKLEIKQDGIIKYEFYEYMDETTYSNYYSQYNSTGTIEVKPTTYTKDDLNIEYSMIDIEYENGTKTITSSDNEFVRYINEYYADRRIVIKSANIVHSSELNVQRPVLTIYEKNTDNVIYTFNDLTQDNANMYNIYSKEYTNDGKITIKEAIIYTNNDVNIVRSNLTIKVAEEPDIVIEDNDARYQDYYNQFFTTGKIVVSVPTVYNIYDDIVVQDPHISITPTGYSAPMIDIYEIYSGDRNVNVNKELFEIYEKEYLENKTVTLKYKQDDVDVDRAYIQIQQLESLTNTNIVATKTTYDYQENYTKYMSDYEGNNEFKKPGIVVYEGALQFKKDELKVVDPSITITDPDTGSVIVKYEADYSKTSDSERYNIYNSKVAEYDKNSQIVNKQITYKAGVNCILEKAHVVNEEIITDKQIVAKLFKDTGVSKVEFLRQCMLGNGDMYNSLVYMNENSYIMNEGDQINVTVKNSNQTIASVFYNLFTANVGDEEVAKIYVDYGGTIKNSGEEILKEETGIITSELGRLFKYTGQAQEVVLSPGTYQIECWGANGGGENGGQGAYVKGLFNIDEITTLYVYVGGKGTEYSETNQENGGFNGGGNSYNGFGGGGATDVRMYREEWDDTLSLLSRIIVAGGGGGSSKAYIHADGSKSYGAGSPSGGISRNANGGTAGWTGGQSSYLGIGASKDAVLLSITDKIAIGHATPNSNINEMENGTLGSGGTVDYDGAGAGGGGYYGGSAAHNEYAGGGGGIGYLYGYLNNHAGVKNEKDGYYYPFSPEILDRYDEDLFRRARELFLDNTGGFRGITNADPDAILEGVSVNISDNVEYPELYDPAGNGCVIIKKWVSEEVKD